MSQYRVSHAAKQLWTFYHLMQPGDLVCAYGNSLILGWGRIIGAYDFEEDEAGYSHVRRVE